MPDPITGSLAAVGLLGGAQVFGANKAANAADKAANLQAQSGRDAIQANKEALQIAREDSQPFRQFGSDQIPALQALLTQQGQADYLNNSPIFQAALKSAQTSFQGSQAARGMLSSGGTVKGLFDRYTSTALPFLQDQKQSLFNALQLGQSAAAGQASATLGTATNNGNILTDIGAARAAGAVGKANAINQGLTGLTSLATTGLGLL